MVWCQKIKYINIINVQSLQLQNQAIQSISIQLNPNTWNPRDIYMKTCREPEIFVSKMSTCDVMRRMRRHGWSWVWGCKLLWLAHDLVAESSWQVHWQAHPNIYIYIHTLIIMITITEFTVCELVSGGISHNLFMVSTQL